MKSRSRTPELQLAKQTIDNRQRIRSKCFIVFWVGTQGKSLFRFDPASSAVMTYTDALLNRFLHSSRSEAMGSRGHHTQAVQELRMTDASFGSRFPTHTFGFKQTT